jgi:hypothetical protein
MIAWCKKYWKWGFPVLLLPLALLLRGFGSLAGFLKFPPRSGNPPSVHFDADKEREQIIKDRETADEAIVTEADRERRDIDSWIDEGLNK